jgi:NAD(P)-dependent dehydrogenase (short-subunit alcohol dehydrogenase family)
VELQGKTAIVTGGAVRLGRAISLALADAGMQIGLHFCHSANAADETLEEIRALGAAAVNIQADFSNPVTAARQIIEETAARFGQIDVLVNNAAIFETGTLETVTDDQWERNIAINLKGPLFLCRAFAGQLKPGQPAHIVNIVDWRATRPDPAHLIYTLTKSGLAALTRNLAVDLAPDVQVNAIAPGAVLAPPGHDRTYLDELANNIPLRRAGSPADVTDTLLYLLGSDFITGEILHVAGGQQLTTG